ncbi:MAG: MBL fold metallo-hydrolase [Gemmobacter sp.]
MNRIVLLCTGGGPLAAPGCAAPGTAALVELDDRSIVVDAGPGVTAALTRAGADLARIDTICITHMHGGHMLELGALVHAVWTAGRTEPLALWGPPGIEACWQGFLSAMAFDAALRAREHGLPPLRSLVVTGRLQDGMVQDGAVAIHALAVPHPPVEHAFALRIDGTRSVTFSGDTAAYPPLARFARGSDVLVHAALLTDRVAALAEGTDTPWAQARDGLMLGHAPADQVGRLARVARAGRLVLHHLIPGTDASPQDWAAQVAAGGWTGPLTVGRDGVEVPL